MAEHIQLGISQITPERKTATGLYAPDMTEQITRMLGGILPGGYGTPPVRGTREFLRAYREMPWLRAVGDRISTHVSAVEWQLFAYDKTVASRRQKTIELKRAEPASRRKLIAKALDAGDLKQITDHPFLSAITTGNSFQTGLGMRKVTQLHLDLVGDAFWLKERNGLGVPIAFWPIPPDWVIATPTPSTRQFRVSFRGWQGAIPDTEILWFSVDDPSNPYGRGAGIAMALADELETDEYTAKHVKSFYFNRARPDLIISPKDGASANEASIKRLEQDWIQRAQGWFRQFKPYFMTRAVEVKELDQNFRTQQLVQLRQFERDTIMQCFGIPPEILGVLMSSNRATIAVSDYLMAEYVTSPRLEFLRTVMQERLIPEYDDKLIVQYPSPVKEDQDQQQAAAAAAPWSLSQDEWRDRSGHKPMEDEDAGAMHFVPGTGKFMTVDEMLNPPAPLPALLAPGQPKPKPGAKPDEGGGLLPGAAGSETNAPPEPKGLYRLAMRETFAGYKVGDRFSETRPVAVVTSLSALEQAKRDAGFNGNTVCVNVIARPSLVRRISEHGATLPAGLSFRIARIDDAGIDVEVVV